MVMSRETSSRSGSRYLQLSLTEKEAYILECILMNIGGRGNHRDRLFAINEKLGVFLDDGDDFSENDDNAGVRPDIREFLTEEYPETDISHNMITKEVIDDPVLMFAPREVQVYDEPHVENEETVEDRTKRYEDEMIEIPGFGFFLPYQH